MTTLSEDHRINFGARIPLSGQAGTLTVTVTGGPLARVCAGVFDKNNQPLLGVGFGPFAPPLTTLNGGTASWTFVAPSQASYLQWGVQAQRSAGRLGDYTVTAHVRNASGQDQVTARYNGQIPQDREADDVIVYDGVYLVQAEGGQQ